MKMYSTPMFTFEGGISFDVEDDNTDRFGCVYVRLNDTGAGNFMVNDHMSLTLKNVSVDRVRAAFLAFNQAMHEAQLTPAELAEIRAKRTRMEETAVAELDRVRAANGTAA